MSCCWRLKDGDGGGDAVERAVVGDDLAVEIALRLLDRSHVDRGCSGRILVGDDGHVVQPALAADDERNAAAIALPAREHACGGAALALLEKLDLALLHLRATVRLHGLHVGVVHPGEAPVLSAQPHGHGERIEQGPAGADLVREALVLGLDAGDLVPMPRHVAQAQDGAAASRPPLRLDVAAGERAHDDVERPPAGKQRVERHLEGRAGAVLEPLAEAQEAIGAVGKARHPPQRLGNDAQGLVLRPRDEDLRLGADDRIGGSKASPQVGALVARGLRLAPRPPRREPGEHKSEDDHAADDGDHRKLLQGQPEQHLAAGSDPAHEQQHAGNARGHETGEVASHANSWGIFGCLHRDPWQENGNPRAETQRAKGKGPRGESRAIMRRVNGRGQSAGPRIGCPPVSLRGLLRRSRRSPQ